jgi:hypothetical protein
MRSSSPRSSSWAAARAQALRQPRPAPKLATSRAALSPRSAPTIPPRSPASTSNTGRPTPPVGDIRRCPILNSAAQRLAATTVCPTAHFAALTAGSSSSCGRGQRVSAAILRNARLVCTQRTSAGAAGAASLRTSAAARCACPVSGQPADACRAGAAARTGSLRARPRLLGRLGVGVALDLRARCGLAKRCVHAWGAKARVRACERAAPKQQRPRSARTPHLIEALHHLVHRDLEHGVVGGELSELPRHRLELLRASAATPARQPSGPRHEHAARPASCATPPAKQPTPRNATPACMSSTEGVRATRIGAARRRGVPAYRTKVGRGRHGSCPLSV